MKTLLPLLFCLSAHTAFGQNTAAVEPDTTHARRLLSVGDSLRNAAQFDASIAAFQQALAIYERLPPDSFLEEKAKANLVQGIILAYRGFEQQSITRLNTAIQWLNKLGNPNHPMLGVAFGQLGFIHCGSSRTDFGIRCHKENLRITQANFGDDHWRMGFPYMGLCECYIEQENFEKCIENAQNALTAFRSFGENDETFGRCYMYIGRAYRGIKFKEEEAIPWFEKAVENSKIAGNPIQEGDAWLQLGLCYKDKKYFDRAIDCCKKAVALLVPALGEFDMTVSNTYRVLGVLNFQIGDIDRAYYFFQKDLVLTDSLFPKGHPLVSETYLGLGAYFLKKQDPRTARNWLLKSQEMMNRCGLAGSQLEAYCLVDLGNCARDMGDDQAAFGYYDSALKILVPKYAGSPLAPDCYLNIAKLLTRQKEYARAREYLSEVLEQVVAARGEGYGAVAELWAALGDEWVYEGNYEQAMKYYDQLLVTFKDDSNALHALLNAHRGKGKCLVITGNEEGLASAQAEFSMAFDLLEQMQSRYLEEGSKQDLIAANIGIVESALTTFQRQFEKTASPDLSAQAFDLVEKSRARALREGLNDGLAFSGGGIPDSIASLEKSLKADIATLQERIYEHQNTPDSVQIPRWSASIFDKKQALQALILQLETSYPDYHRLKYNTALASASDIQHQLLDHETAILEYFVGDSTIFNFILTKNNLQLVSLPMPSDFENTVENLRKSLTDSGLRATETDAPLFGEAASKLYSWLLEKTLATLPPQVKNLVIVPDGSLGYVPFEVLGKVVGQADFKTFPYLLRNFNVSYAASANLLLEQPGRFGNSGQTELFAGFAPSYSASDNFDKLPSTPRRELVRDEKYDLPGAAKEVEEIAALLGGKAYFAKEASERNFKANAPRFHILHLAMHAMLDDRNPLFSKLLFTNNPQDSTEDNDLNANELYNIRLPAADLVVLSACNTGAGALRRGEGIMSLSRAFTYAGVPATVMSLWKAPDEATRKVMVSFYGNLKLGMRKDEALRQAKLAYLSNCGDAVASPYYWAGFVAGGGMGPLFSGN